MDMSNLDNVQIENASRVADSAIKQGVDPDFAVAVAYAESKLRIPNKPSSAGAIGIMQLMPDTVSLYNKKHKMNINPNDLDSNIDGGVFILKDMLNTYKTPQNAVIAYNTSTDTRNKFFALYAKDPDAAMKMLPQETVDYGTKVGENYNLADENAPPDGEPSIFGHGETEAQKIAKERKRSGNENAPDDSVFIGGSADAATVGTPIGVLKGLIERGAFGKKPEIPLSKAVGEATDAFNTASKAEKDARLKLPSEMQVENTAKPSHFVDQPLEAEYKSQLPQAQREAAAAEEALRASGAKVQGASGASNWMRSMAGPQHQLPENILASATDMTKASPTGGQRLINEDLLNLKKIKGMGGGYSLAGTGTSQLMLPRGIAGEQDAKFAAQRAAHQAALTKASDEASARLAKAKEIEESVAKYKTSQSATSEAKSALDAATLKDKSYKLIAPFRSVGAALAKSPIITNALSGAGTAMSVEEAVYRYNHGDVGGVVLNTLAAAFGLASMVPARSPASAITKGVGVVGGLGLIPFQMGYEHYNPRQPQKKVRGGLVRNSR